MTTANLKLSFHCIKKTRHSSYYIHIFNSDAPNMNDLNSIEMIEKSEQRVHSHHRLQATAAVADKIGEQMLSTPSVIRRQKNPSHSDNMRGARQNLYTIQQHRKSLSESDLLNEIDSALVFSKGFLYSYGKCPYQKYVQCSIVYLCLKIVYCMHCHCVTVYSPTANL